MDLEQYRRIQTRRNFFRNCAGGIGTAALANLLNTDGYGASVAPDTNPLAPHAPMFAPKAKNVIFMFMEGGPSQLDLFDPKPELAKWNGKPLPSSITKDLQLAFIKPTAAVLASPRQFSPCGQSGMEISDIRLSAALARGRRRYLPGPVDAYRCVQSSSRPASAVQRDHPGGPSDNGRMGSIRAR
jgi:hypothetical protein